MSKTRLKASSVKLYIITQVQSSPKHNPLKPLALSFNISHLAELVSRDVGLSVSFHFMVIPDWNVSTTIGWIAIKCIVSRWWILMTLVTPWLFIDCPQENTFSYPVKYLSENTSLFVIRHHQASDWFWWHLVATFLSAERMNCKNGEPLTLVNEQVPVMPSQLLDGMRSDRGTDIYGTQKIQ